VIPLFFGYPYERTTQAAGSEAGVPGRHPILAQRLDGCWNIRVGVAQECLALSPIPDRHKERLTPIIDAVLRASGAWALS
jgi:hypothetical protein